MLIAPCKLQEFADAAAIEKNAVPPCFVKIVGRVLQEWRVRIEHFDVPVVIVMVVAVQAGFDIFQVRTVFPMHADMHKSQHIRIRKCARAAFWGIGPAAEIFPEMPCPGLHLLNVDAENVGCLRYSPVHD